MERPDTEHPNYERLDALFRADRYAATLGLEVVDWGGGWSRVRYAPTDEHHNFGGSVHGGAVFSIGDVAFSIASNSWGRRAVALTIDTHFLATPAIGRPVAAEASERSRTRSTASYQIELTDDEGPVASLHAMVYRLPEWFFGEDAWPRGWLQSH